MEFTTHFGKSLINAVQLKLKTGSIDEVYTLLDELVANVQEQQTDADEEYQVNNVQWNNQIATYTETIATLSADITTQSANLADFESQNLTHTETLDSLVTNGVALADQLEALNDWFVSFTDSYNVRQAERQRVLDALDTIIAMLTDAYNAGSFVQLKDLVKTLKSVKGQKNPILSLVQLTLSFNPATVKNVIDRLTTVRDSVSTGASEDSTYYEYTKGLYTVQESDLESQIQQNTEAQNAEVVTLADLRNSIEDTESRLESDNLELANTQSLLEATQTSQESYNAKYADDTAIRF